MKKLLLAASVASLLSASVQADTLLGLYLGGQVWDAKVTGVFGEADQMEDFNLSDKQQGSFFVAFEHPIPLIPNIKIASTTLDTDGQSTFGTDFSFGGADFTKGDKVDAIFDMSFIDYTLYYEILDNDLFTLDLGLTARDIDSNITVGLTSDMAVLSGNEDVSAYIPMVYASVIIGLPFTGLNLFAEGNFSSYDDNTMYDYQAGISYELLDNLAIDLNITAGYRSIVVDLNDLDDFYADLDFKGAFIGATVHF